MHVCKCGQEKIRGYTLSNRIQEILMSLTTNTASPTPIPLDVVRRILSYPDRRKAKLATQEDFAFLTRDMLDDASSDSPVNRITGARKAIEGQQINQMVIDD